MKFKTEPTRDDLKERADEEGVELTGDEKPKVSMPSSSGTTKRSASRSSSSASKV